MEIFMLSFNNKSYGCCLEFICDSVNGFKMVILWFLWLCYFWRGFCVKFEFLFAARFANSAFIALEGEMWEIRKF